MERLWACISSFYIFKHASLVPQCNGDGNLVPYFKHRRHIYEYMIEIHGDGEAFCLDHVDKYWS